ncbi:uncharacterized protein LOC6604985 isoform X5 [Drosophila sechellia]|uniref:uncharacterized protein LOC6604985 isoform X5 n=1 Tax=Drosophila sechellia TaxID=7238 RepID=UPI0013DE1659|nr:uncharacterized protein LOC6604985 isoform X5 [Drosophila sechellia]
MRGTTRSEAEHCTGHQKAAQSSAVNCGHKRSRLLYHHAASTDQQYTYGSVRSRCLSASRWSASHLPTFSHAISAILSVLQCANECTHHLASELPRKPFAIAALADVKPAFTALPVASTIPMLEYRGSEGYFAEGIAIDGCNSGGYSSKGWNSTTTFHNRGSNGGGDTQ